MSERAGRAAGSWARREAVSPESVLHDPDVRRRVARADLVLAIGARDELVGVLHGWPLFREIGRGRGAEFRPIEIVVVAIGSDAPATLGRDLVREVQAIKSDPTARARTDRENLLLFPDGAI